MMWDQVLLRLVDLIKTDQTLHGIFGDNSRMAGTGKLEIPSIEWSLVGDSETELWAPCIIQFDLWHTLPAKIVEAERRLRILFHTSLPATFDGLTMWCEYIDGDILASPDRNNFAGRAVRFKFTPLRSKYVLTGPITHTP